MTNEVYFNTDELNLFKKSSKNSDQNGIDFFLPNSITENFSSNFLQKVRLTRQFRQTLASVRSETLSRDSGNGSEVTDFPNDTDDIDDYLFSGDENKPENKEILQKVFTEWRILIDIR